MSRFAFQIIKREKISDEAAAYGNSHAQNINERYCFLPDEIANSSFKIIAEHGVRVGFAPTLFKHGATMEIPHLEVGISKSKNHPVHFT